MIKILEFIGLRGKNSPIPPIDKYIDKHTKLCGIGDIPKNIRVEFAALIRNDCGTHEFSTSILRTLCKSEREFELVELVIRRLLLAAEKVIGTKAPAKGEPLYPWVKALYISPQNSVNAFAALSQDTQVKACVIVINAGTFVQLTRRLLRIFADENFVEVLNEGILNPLRYEGRSSIAADIPLNENLALISVNISFLASMVILSHELAHFFGGHLGYLRSTLGLRTYGEFERLDMSKYVGDGPKFASLRRLLEFDADEVGGKLYSVIMREFDHPVAGPKEGHNERFFLFSMVAIASTCLVFEETEKSEDYCAPSWRANIFFSGFANDFFSKMPDDTQTDVFFNVMGYVDRAFTFAGWGSGFDFAAAVSENDRFLQVDVTNRKLLRQELAKHRPPS